VRFSAQFPRGSSSQRRPHTRKVNEESTQRWCAREKGE
jgi:hypothetical protein